MHLEIVGIKPNESFESRARWRGAQLVVEAELGRGDKMTNNGSVNSNMAHDPVQSHLTVIPIRKVILQLKRNRANIFLNAPKRPAPGTHLACQPSTGQEDQG